MASPCRLSVKLRKVGVVDGFESFRSFESWDNRGVKVSQVYLDKRVEPLKKRMY
jgi:hypothetical protein